MSSDSSDTDISRTLRSDGGIPTNAGGMEVYTVVRGAVKDALLDVIGLLLQLGLGLALVFLGAQTVLWSMSVGAVIIGVVLLVAGIFLAAPILRLVQPLRI